MSRILRSQTFSRILKRSHYPEEEYVDMVLDHYGSLFTGSKYNVTLSSRMILTMRMELKNAAMSTTSPASYGHPQLSPGFCNSPDWKKEVRHRERTTLFVMIEQTHFACFNFAKLAFFCFNGGGVR